VLCLDSARIGDLRPYKGDDEIRDRLALWRRYQLNPVPCFHFIEVDLNLPLNSLSALIQSDDGPPAEIFSPEQIEAIEQLFDEYLERNQDFSDMRRALREKGAGDEEITEVLRNENRKRADAYLKRIRSDVLFDVQVQQLIEFLRQRDARTLGVAGILTMNELGGRPVSTGQREEMRTILKEAIQDLESEVSALYERAIDEQLSCLPADLRTEIKETLGPPPAYAPNLSLLSHRIDLSVTRPD
jgi:hypothetical protein